MLRRTRFISKRVALVLALTTVCLAQPSTSAAYSVLAHEALIDGAWNSQIMPLLRRRFPRASREDLEAARAFAYGGSAVQDLGYYPLGNHFVSDLLHYVRTGDFVEILLSDARNPNEYAFGLGSLAHYVADNTGHPEAINRSVPILFPRLRQKYGDLITYEQARAQHIIVEFSFDVVQTAAGRYGPEAYSRFIGFDVPEDLLDRAFRDTYGLELKTIFGRIDSAIGTYRFSVSQIIPAITQAAWRQQHDEIIKLIPHVDEQSFVFRLSRAQYETSYGTDYRRPGWFARFLAFIYRLLPKIGPLRPLQFTTPTPQAEEFFVKSLADASRRYQTILLEIRANRLKLRNTNFDTGGIAHHGQYWLSDDAYARLVHELARTHFSGVSSELRQNILEYYDGVRQPTSASKEERGHWKRLQHELDQLRRSPTR